MQPVSYNQVHDITDKGADIKCMLMGCQKCNSTHEILMDYGLGKAMEEALDDEELDLKQAMELTGYRT